MTRDTDGKGSNSVSILWIILIVILVLLLLGFFSRGRLVEVRRSTFR